jgi:N-acetylneuraminic acid mutarotase
MCPLLTLVKALRFRLIALALCSLGGLAITLWPAAEAQEVSAPNLPHPFRQSRVISSEAPPEALVAPEATALAGNPIPTARDGHTATLLSDGRVLVAGGRGAGGGALDSVQIFNPATGQWTTTKNLGAPRYGHAAVLLQNGRVLVAGGRSSSNSFLKSSEIYNPVTGAWTAGPNLVAERAGATATLLPTTASPAPFSNSQSVIPPAPPADAQVLLAGGENSTGTLNSAELFNPAANQWKGEWKETSRPMLSRRRDHTATLVRGGFVVVTGGRDGQAPLKSVEMYFPNHPPELSWCKTTDMSSPRFGHTTSALNDGRTLVAGGHDGIRFLNSAAIFDSNNRTWTAARNLNTARRSHSATLLPSGKVYVAGGFNGSAVKTAETYDPATNGWTVEQLSAARSSHAAIMLATGSALLVAGNTDDSGAVINSTELVDSAAGFWNAAPSNTLPLVSHSSVLLANGKVLSMGGLRYTTNGYQTYWFSFANAWLFDPAANGGAGAWSGTGAMRTDRHLFPATLLRNSEVLVCGGFRIVNGADVVTNAAETYNPSSGAWTSAGPMNTARTDHTATLLPDGRVLVTGGLQIAGGYDVAIASAEIYNPSTRLWTPAPSMPTARTGHRATLLADGRVLVTGGFSTAQNASLQSVEIYNPATNTWTSARPLNDRRDTHTATLLPSGRVLVVGGVKAAGGSGVVLSSAEIYNPIADFWSLTDRLDVARFNHTATLLPTGKVLVAGGVAGNDGVSANYLASAEVYDPATGDWRATGNLGTPRARHTVTLLPDGRLLAIGGVRGYFLDTSNWLSSAAAYNAGLGHAENLRPILSGVEWGGLRGAGSPLRATGVLLQGGSEAVGGGAQDTATNYPLLQLRSLDSGRTLFLPPGDASGWSNNFITTRTIADNAFPGGFALLTVITNGVPSVAQIVETSVPSGGSTSQNNMDVGSISGRVLTPVKTPLPNIRITLKREPGSGCSAMERSIQTNANGGYSFLELGVRCSYTITPGPASIGNLPLTFTPAQRRHFLPCSSCDRNSPQVSAAAPNAPEQGDNTGNQQHVANSDFVATFNASVAGKVTRVTTGAGIRDLPLTLTPISPVAEGDGPRNTNTASNIGSQGSYGFGEVALGGNYTLSVNNSAATNLEFAYSPISSSAPVPGNSAELINVRGTLNGQDFVAEDPLTKPSITNLSPNTFTAGGRSFQLAVTGSGFSPSVTQLRWDILPRATIVNSDTQLTAAIGEQDIAVGGTVFITAVNRSVFQTKISDPVPVTIVSPSADSGAVPPAPEAPQAWEADVGLRSTGDGEVSSDDLAQIARFVAGLDTPRPGSEFQRADCAPRLAEDGVTLLRGDGRLTVRDWVLAERYRAGLDPPTAAGGPAAPLAEMGHMGVMGVMGQMGQVANAASLRTLRLVNYGAGVKAAHSIAVEVNALGGENAFGFSLSFDPARWRVSAAVAGHDLKSARLLLNTMGANGGRVGVALALPPGESLSAGGRQLATITFVSLSPSGAEFDPAGFSDEPVAREVADGEANLLPANFAVNNDLPLAVCSSADFNLATLASESLATAFGRDLADGTLTAETLPLPTTLGGAQVIVRDSLGVERLAPILFVSPGQINFQVPAETAPGLAVVTVIGENHRRAVAVVEIKPAAPALFTADSSDHGLAVGMVMRMRRDGQATFEPTLRFDPSSKKFIAAPIDLERDPSGGEDQVFLLLFGTGIRHGGTMSVTIAGAPAELTYAGAQNGYAGLDQINIPLTRDLAGRGEVDVVLIVDGQRTSPVKAHFR